MAKRNFEFWAVDKNGHKWHEYISVKHTRISKVKAAISKKYNIDIDKCLDFDLIESTE